MKHIVIRYNSKIQEIFLTSYWIVINDAVEELTFYLNGHQKMSYPSPSFEPNFLNCFFCWPSNFYTKRNKFFLYTIISFPPNISGGKKSRSFVIIKSYDNKKIAKTPASIHIVVKIWDIAAIR